MAAAAIPSPVKPLRVLCCGRECELPGFLDLRGLLSFWLLWELRRETRTGADLSDRLAWRRGSPVSPGTLYPALLKLEQEGCVTAKWRPSENNRRAKYYSLTAAGRKQLAREARDWHRTADLIAAFLAPRREAP